MNPAKPDVTKDEEHIEDLRLILDDVPSSVSRRGIIHVGAHDGQEVAEYFAAGFDRVILIEANPHWSSRLHERYDDDPRVKVYDTAIADRIGTTVLQIHTSRRGSTEPASILPMKEFKRIVTALHTPETIEVPVTTLDALVANEGIDLGAYNFLNLDIQGAELLALRGAEKVLAGMDAVISEVALLELYVGQALEGDIVEHMEHRGFCKRRAIYHTMYDEDSTFPAWGECLFVKREFSKDPGS